MRYHPSPGQPWGKFSKFVKSQPPRQIFYSNDLPWGFPDTLFWSAGALSTIAMLLSLGGYIYVTMYLTDYILCLVVPFQPRFQSDFLASPLTALSKRSTMYTNVFTHRHTELPISSLCCNR